MKKYFFSLFLWLIFLPIFAHAATVSLIINTGSISINTLSATFTFPPDAKLTGISDGGSPVLLWIQNPEIGSDGRTLSFAGLTPGGFSGRRALLTISGDFTADDLDRVTTTGAVALENDGKGTSVPVSFSFASSTMPADVVPPEPFALNLASSPNAYGGEYFVSFAAEDKGTGVDHYDVAYARFFSPSPDDWTGVSSPLVIPRDALSKKIYVRAVDRAGNVRVEAVHGPDYYDSLERVAVLFLLLVCVLYYFASRFF